MPDQYDDPVLKRLDTLVVFLLVFALATFAVIATAFWIGDIL